MKTTPNLGLRKPDQEDFYNVDDFNFNADVLDAEVTAVKNQVTNHRHTGAAGDAPPIPITGIESAAKTSAGGTEPNRLAMTDANGRVGDASKLGGYPAADYARIVEMGSNSNGEYIRFANGIQICWKGRTANGPSPQIVTFPASFIDSKWAFVAISSDWPAAIITTNWNDRTPYSTKIHKYSHDGTEYTGVYWHIDYVVIGRWK